MRWFFLALFALSASFWMADFFMRRRKLDAVVVSASLVRLPNVQDAYQVMAECKVVRTGALAYVVGRARTISEPDVLLFNDQLRALQGCQIPIYQRPSNFNYSSDIGPFRGYSLDTLIVGLTAIGALSAWLYSVWGAHPLFALLKLIGVGQG